MIHYKLVKLFKLCLLISVVDKDEVSWVYCFDVQNDFSQLLICYESNQMKGSDSHVFYSWVTLFEHVFINIFINWASFIVFFLYWTEDFHFFFSYFFILFLTRLTIWWNKIKRWRCNFWLLWLFKVLNLLCFLYNAYELEMSFFDTFL